MEQEFLQKFKAVLENPDMSIKMEDRFREYEDWSSLAFLSLIAMIDEEYDVIIEGKEFRELHTVGDILDAVKAQQLVSK